MKTCHSLIASLALLATLAAPALAGVNLPPLDPTYVVGLQSINSDTDARILFDNQTSFSVNIYWINYSGTEVLYHILPSGNSVLQGTYLTHPWIARRTSDNSAIVGFLPVSAISPTAPDYDIATITEDPTPVEARTWGGIKALFSR